jgi:hypothetical protein
VAAVACPATVKRAPRTVAHRLIASPATRSAPPPLTQPKPMKHLTQSSRRLTLPHTASVRIPSPRPGSPGRRLPPRRGSPPHILPGRPARLPPQRPLGYGPGRRPVSRQRPPPSTARETPITGRPDRHSRRRHRQNSSRPARRSAGATACHQDPPATVAAGEVSRYPRERVKSGK